MEGFRRSTLLAVLLSSAASLLAGCLHPIRAARALVAAPAPDAPRKPG